MSEREIKTSFVDWSSELPTPPVREFEKRSKTYSENAKQVAIAKIVDDILANAPHFDEAINWGDLRCVKVSLDIHIVIEEAAPGCEQLAEYVIDELAKRGFTEKITVETEW